MMLQLQAKDNEMKSMVASINNTNKAHELDQLESQLNFRQKHRQNIISVINKKGFKSIDDYMGQVWGFDDNRYLPRGN